MNRGRRALFASLLAGLAVAALSSPSPSLAAPPGAKPPAAKQPPQKPGPRDKAAMRLDADAMGTDYLETSFIRAERKLLQAISLCGKQGCSPRVLAQLHRDLGVLRIGGLAKIDAGKTDFSRAIEVDPAVQLDPDYATPAMKKIWKEVRGEKEGAAEEEQPQGIGHTPVSEQAVATPVPIYVTYAGGPEKVKLLVWYRAVGAKRWASVPMESAGAGFGAEIPCNALATAGDLSYFVEALGESDETLGKEGSRLDPHVVHVRKEIDGEAPHLPDAAPPAHCKDVCVGEHCKDAAPHPRNNWFSLSVQQDLAIVGASVGTCTEDIQVSGGWSCFRAQGDQYLGNPIAGRNDSVNGGLGVGTTRLLLGFDRVLVEGLTLGVRLGAVLRGGGPRPDGAGAHPFLPIHAEGRLAYWFGSQVFWTSGFRPFVFVAGGLAQVDSHFSLQVFEDPTKRPPPSQTDNPSEQILTAYRHMGQAFAGGGAGFMVAFTPGSGMFLSAKYMRMFPTAGNVLSPELGFALGF